MGLNKIRHVLILVVFTFGAWTHAQLLTEVQLVAATSLELNSAVHLPSGSYRAVGKGSQELIALVPEAGRFTGWEVYTATGLAARLQPAFVGQVMSSFAVAGYFLADQSEEKVGNETRTHYLFRDEGGHETLLYVVRSPQELVWLVAKAR